MILSLKELLKKIECNLRLHYGCRMSRWRVAVVLPFLALARLSLELSVHVGETLIVKNEFRDG